MLIKWQAATVRAVLEAAALIAANNDLNNALMAEALSAEGLADVQAMLMTENKALAEQVRVLREALQDASNHMDRARNILTDGKPTPECNWGMLATESARAALEATK